MTQLAMTGFSNQMSREWGTWWATGRWWVQAVVWLLLTNGLLGAMLWIVPNLEGMTGAPTMTVQESAAQFMGVAAALVSIGTVVLAQGILIDDQRSGVLEWMLSKPLGRGSLVAAKFGGQAVGLVVTVVIVPWTVVLAQLSAARGGLWPVWQWLAGVGVLTLLVLFHLALVLVVSVLTWSRALVLAVPLAGILGADLLVAAAPGLVSWLPWSGGRVAGPLLGDGVLVSAGPLLVAGVLTVGCLLVAAWGMRRAEL